VSLKLTIRDGRVHVVLKVVPGARREKIVGLLGDALKVAVSKPPQGGEANRAVIALLARALGIAESQVQIIRGLTSPRKEVAIQGLDAQSVQTRLLAEIGT
jgi:uncharacterized protein (TIGR00251 family)